MVSAVPKHKTRSSRQAYMPLNFPHSLLIERVKDTLTRWKLWLTPNKTIHAHMTPNMVKPWQVAWTSDLASCK